MSQSPTPPRVLRQRPWTEAELKAAHFRYFKPRKRLVMARVIDYEKHITVSLETLVARAGTVICYPPGDSDRPDLDSYDHWPVQMDLFIETYTAWDEYPWVPTPPQADLMRHGCRPYYKKLGVWAMRLGLPVYVQSLESPEPVMVPAGRWLCIGPQGEPYHMNDDNFRQRYILE